MLEKFVFSIQARLKKTSASGPAGGRNCGQSGGHNPFLHFLGVW